MRQVSLGAKLISGFLVVVVMLAVVGGVAYWGATQLSSKATVMRERLDDVGNTTTSLYWATKQYQALADTIINKDPGAETEFLAAVDKMDAARDLVAKKLDHDDEKAWMAEVLISDKKFDDAYNKKNTARDQT